MLQVKIGGSLLGDCLDNADIDALALTTRTEYFDEGIGIVKEGDRGDMLYMIEEGTVSVTKTNLGPDSISILKQGDFFGEKAILASDTRMATYTAKSRVKCLILVRDDFIRILGNLKEILDQSNERRLALHRQETIKNNSNMKRSGIKYK